MKKNFSQAKVAFVYDRVNTPFGGAENVLMALHRVFPEAPLFTSVYDPDKAKWAKDFQIQSSFLQKIPFAKKFHRAFVPLMPLAFESFSLSEYDVVISVTSAEAKGVITRPDQLHLCYLLTPTRYLWSHQEEYQQHWLTGELRREMFAYLRWWDEAAAMRPDFFIPISELVAERCQKYYHRQPMSVLYPPVDVQPFRQKEVKQVPSIEEYYLVVARLVPYKRIDLAIQACQQLRKKLVIIGDGPDYQRLQRLAQKGVSPEQITFLRSVQRDEAIAYYQRCQGFLFPAEEDFGITAIEAQAAGKPVAIYARSGAAELVQDGVGGVHFHQQTVTALADALKELEKKKWQPELIKKQIAQFDVQYFERRFRETVQRIWEDFQEKG